MASKKSKKTQASQVYGVQMQIFTPQPVVIPIPSKRLDFSSIMEFAVTIKNNTSSPLPFLFWGCLIPEIVAPNEQEIKPRKIINISNNKSYFFIGVGELTAIRLQAQLYWQNNFLIFQITPNPKFYWEALISTTYSWTFEQIEGKYQLRFIYRQPDKELISSITDIEQSNKLLAADTIATPYLNLHLVKPTEKYNAVEIDGICFRTLVQQIVNVPKKAHKVRESIKLAGIRISNNSCNHLYFSLYATLFPEIIDTNGHPLEQSYASDWVREPDTSDFILANPGRHITFFPGGSIGWDHNEKLVLYLEDCVGGTYFFWFPSLGSFRIRFKYINDRNAANVHDRKNSETKQIKNIWTGTIVTPFVEFNLTDK